MTERRTCVLMGQRYYLDAAPNPDVVLVNVADAIERDADERWWQDDWILGPSGNFEDDEISGHFTGSELRDKMADCGTRFCTAGFTVSLYGHHIVGPRLEPHDLIAEFGQRLMGLSDGAAKILFAAEWPAHASGSRLSGRTSENIHRLLTLRSQMGRYTTATQRKFTADVLRGMAERWTPQRRTVTITDLLGVLKSLMGVDKLHSVSAA